MMDSMNNYLVKDTCDAYLLCQRVEDLEKDVTILKELMNSIALDIEERTEYVKLCTYNRDIQLLRDEQDILQKDIDRINGYSKSTKKCKL